MNRHPENRSPVFGLRSVGGVCDEWWAPPIGWPGAAVAARFGVRRSLATHCPGQAGAAGISSPGEIIVKLSGCQAQERSMRKIKGFWAYLWPTQDAASGRGAGWDHRCVLATGRARCAATRIRAPHPDQRCFAKGERDRANAAEVPSASLGGATEPGTIRPVLTCMWTLAQVATGDWLQIDRVSALGYRSANSPTDTSSATASRIRFSSPTLTSPRST